MWSWKSDRETISNLFVREILDDPDSCYEFFDLYHDGYEGFGFYRSKLMLRILPLKRCVDRMIRKNFYKENKSLMAMIDFELAF
jgi:hypothetical protein